MCLITVSMCALSLFPHVPHYHRHMCLVIVIMCTSVSLLGIHLVVITAHSPCCHYHTFALLLLLLPHSPWCYHYVSTSASSPCVPWHYCCAFASALLLHVCPSIITMHLPQHCHYAFALALSPCIFPSTVAMHLP